MKTINKIMELFEDYLLFILIIAMTAIITIQIVLRVSGGQLQWTEETARYLFIWVIYLGCSRAVRKHSELSVDIVHNMLKGKKKEIFKIITNLLCLLFSVIFVRYSLELVNNLAHKAQYSPAMNYNLIMVYLASAIASIFMSIRYIQNIVGNIKGLQKFQAATDEERS